MAAALTATATEAADSCAQWSKAWPCVDKLNAMLDYEIRKLRKGAILWKGEVHTYIYVHMYAHMYVVCTSKQHKEYNPI